MKVDGKTAIVVGGVRGIGKSYCEALLDKGAKVVLGDVLSDVGEATIKEFNDKYGDKRALFVKCDVTKQQDIKNLFEQAKEHYGATEICIYNAAILDEHQWENMLNINLIGCIRTVNEAVECMSRETGGLGGIFLATASIGAFTVHSGVPAYSASKHGIIGTIRCWGSPEVYAKTGMRFNCLCPTAVLTDMLRDLPSRFRHRETLYTLPQVQPLQPSFIAEGMMKLVEDDSVTGQALRCSRTYGHDYAELPNYDFQ